MEEQRTMTLRCRRPTAIKNSDPTTKTCVVLLVSRRPANQPGTSHRRSAVAAPAVFKAVVAPAASRGCRGTSSAATIRRAMPSASKVLAVPRAPPRASAASLARRRSRCTPVPLRLGNVQMLRTARQRSWSASVFGCVSARRRHARQEGRPRLGRRTDGRLWRRLPRPAVCSSVRDALIDPSPGRFTGFEQGEETAGATQGNNAKFLVWAKEQAADTSDFLFSDLAPLTSTAPNVAAGAFYKVLSLASKGLMNILQQDEPYGEVCSISSRVFIPLIAICRSTSQSSEVLRLPDKPSKVRHMQRLLIKDTVLSALLVSGLLSSE